MRLATRMFIVAAIGVAAVTLSGAGLSAQASRQAEAQLRAAQQLEEVTGDLVSAIEEYRRILNASDRTIAAQALLGLARCQDKLGLPEAQESLRKVVAQFADQPSIVAEARKRLAALVAASESPYRQRLLWTLAPNDLVTGRVSPDGEWVAYMHLPRSLRNELRIRNLVTGIDRLVAEGRPEEVDFEVLWSAFSRDGQRIAYRATFNFRGQFHQQLRVADLRDPSTTGHRVLRDDLAVRTPIGTLVLSGVTPYDWTPDGNWIAVSHITPGVPMRQYGLVSAADGSVRTLTRRGGSVAYLSPDGKWLAAEVREPGTNDNDIIVVPADGGDEIPVVAAKGHDTLMGWSPDGQDLIFSSSRSGPKALWRQSLDNGTVRGPAQLIPNLTTNADRSIGLSPEGSLYTKIAKRPEPTYVMEAVFDFAKGEFVSEPREVAETFVRSNSNPRWSPDGKQLAYYSDRGPRDAAVLMVRSVETGETREVRPAFRFVNLHTWTWLPDNQSIAALGQPRSFNNNRRDLYRIDMRTGESTLLATVNGSGRPELSEDGKTLYYNHDGMKFARDLATGQETDVGQISQSRPFYTPDGKSLITTRGVPGGFAIVQRDTASGATRDLVTLFPPSRSWNWFVTSDFKYIVGPTTDRTTGDAVVVLHSIDAGTTTELLKMPGEPLLAIRALAKDNQSIIVNSNMPRTYWWVPLDGRAPKTLDALEGLDYLLFELSPDGRRIAFNVRDALGGGEQVWVLENFLRR